MMFTSLLRGRSVTVHSLTQKEKGLSDLKFREEICLSVCVSLLKRSLCEDDESQKDFFEREDEYNEANTGPLKSQERFFLNKTSLFCVSETFGCTKGHLWECTTSRAPQYFFIFHFKSSLNSFFASFR
jgi:hypothetical protein